MRKGLSPLNLAWLALGRVTTEDHDHPMSLAEFGEQYVTEEGSLYDDANFGDPPGARRVYCNAGYGLLGHLLEVASDSPLEALSEARLFGPLRMDGPSWFLRDTDLARLQSIDERLSGKLVTVVAHPFHVARAAEYADVLVGAVMVPGERAPVVFTRAMLRKMKPGSLFLDLSIDQGGCAETSRPTTHESPTYVAEGVVHCCIPNPAGGARHHPACSLAFCARLPQRGRSVDRAGRRPGHRGRRRGGPGPRPRPRHPRGRAPEFPAGLLRPARRMRQEANEPR